MASELPARLRMIIDPPEMISVGHGRYRAIERKNLESMAGQIEVADNLRAQQGHHIRKYGKLEAGNDFFGNCSAAEHVPPFEHEHFLALAGEISRVDQAVVPAADDNNVVFLGHEVCPRFTRDQQAR